MTNVTKKQLNSVSRQLTAKAQSWGQIAKQLSGMNGKIELTKGKKISVHDAFIMLGVHTKNNKYSAADLNMAWSERLKESKPQHTTTSFNTDTTWTCPLLCKAVPMTAKVGENEYKLYKFEKSEYKMHKVQTLCRVVKAEDKRKNSDDIIVSAQVVLKGLVQSIFVDDTLKGMTESQNEANALNAAYINVGSSTVPKFVQIAKGNDGNWSIVTEKAVNVKVKVSK